MSRVVDERISLKARGKPTVSSGRKAAVRDAGRQGSRTPPGSKSRAYIHRGSSGTWESQLSPCHIPGLGDRATKGPGAVGELRPDHEPQRDTTNARKQARYRGASDKRRVPRGAAWQSSRSIVPGKGGNQGPRNPREGRRRRASRGTGQTDGRYLESPNRHTKTPAPCGAGRPRPRSGGHHPGAPD